MLAWEVYIHTIVYWIVFCVMSLVAQNSVQACGWVNGGAGASRQTLGAGRKKPSTSTQHGTNHCNHCNHCPHHPTIASVKGCQAASFDWVSEASGICPADHQGHSRGASKSHGASEGRRRRDVQPERSTESLADIFYNRLPWTNFIIEAFWSLRAAGAKKRSWPTAIVAPWTC